MKNDKDINSSLSEIKKVLIDESETSKNKTEKNDIFLLEDVVKKVELNKKLNKEKIDEKSIINISENKSKKINLIKKSKIKKEKITNLKKVNKKSNPVENVINKEIKPIIQNWIKNNFTKEDHIVLKLKLTAAYIPSFCWRKYK